MDGNPGVLENSENSLLVILQNQRPGILQYFFIKKLSLWSEFYVMYFLIGFKKCSPNSILTSVTAADSVPTFSLP